MTWRSLLKSSLRLIGQLGPGRSAGPSETADALTVLTAMLSSWSTQRLSVYTIARSTHTLTGASDYTIGTGADFDTARPTRIDAAALLAAGSTTEQPIDVYRLIGSPRREGLYYSFGFPVATIHLEPAPAAGDTLALYVWQPLGAVTDADLDDEISFPPGYEDAIRYNLAVRLAPEWGKVPRADVQKLAGESLAVIKAHNRPALELRCDAALLDRGGFDVMRGDYR